jgi:hypothetical protein
VCRFELLNSGIGRPCWGGIFQEASLNRTYEKKKEKKESSKEISEDSIEKFLSRTRAERRALLRVRLFLENQR